MASQSKQQASVAPGQSRAAGEGRPRVTVGMPVYNGENFLEEALRSILAQTFEDFELVISDNASADRTEEICRAYAERDARIRYVRQPRNLGGAPNFNFVFDAARGEYFTWASHDDVVAPTYLERCVAELDRNPRAVAAFPGLAYIDDQGRVQLRQRRPDLSVRGGTAADRAGKLVDLQLENDDVYWAIFGLMRSDMLRTTRMLGSYVAADQVLLVEIVLRGDMIQVPEELYHRREHADASMTKHRTAQERAAWFDSRNEGKLVWPHWTLLFKHLAAVHDAEIAPGTRGRCYLVMLRRFLHLWRALAGDVKIVAGDMRRLAPRAHVSRPRRTTAAAARGARPPSN